MYSEPWYQLENWDNQQRRLMRKNNTKIGLLVPQLLQTEIWDFMTSLHSNTCIQGSHHQLFASLIHHTKDYDVQRFHFNTVWTIREVRTIQSCDTFTSSMHSSGNGQVSSKIIMKKTSIRLNHNSGTNHPVLMLFFL